MISGIYSKCYILKHRSIKNAIVNKDIASSTNIKNLHATGLMQVTDLRMNGGDSNFYDLTHRTIRNAIVDKDRPTFTKITNHHETGQIISYRPENYWNRFEILRPETWNHSKRTC